jgi:DNA-binding beta-propeller fold protein YncE
MISKKILLVLVSSLISVGYAQSLTLTQTVPLEGVTGKLDHSSVDSAGGRLFASAWAMNSVKVIDLRQGKVVHSIEHLSKPQGVLYIPELGRLYAATEGDGALHVIDPSDYSTIAVVPLGEDADNIRYDAAAGRLYVGYEDGALGIIDAKTNQLIEKVPLKAHPEAFSLATRSARIVLNTPRSHNVTVYDRQLGKVVAEWPMGDVNDNFTMTLDEANDRAFIGSRKPPFFFVFDLSSGREIARLPVHGNTDDFHYDSKRRQIYASCGEGFIDIYTQVDADHYVLKESVKTAPLGRTCAFDGDNIYLSVQDSPGQTAEIRCYRVK